MPDGNPLHAHNDASIDKATRAFVECARRAVTEVPHGSLTLKIEWRASQVFRYVTNEELSIVLPTIAAD